ncbi:hypothetical protein CERZMDRAFT_31471 [Cercospora zeae-maydis SCOH1-5]|uniref:Mitochondrial import inner membrane translocase subunit Tim21 n=1 Tax=Cercospora zeae-maydis SCOH1-5 TaxID=717836 RepID=A0A6A6FVF9_9PEZI|nr:hypothetical protein CERZMDRAFT_31471 [Cercospora zeae-maydis SCOH1-5]
MIERLTKLPVSRQIPALLICQSVARPAAAVSIAQQSRYATTSSFPKGTSSRRRSVTVINDTGAVPWENLTPGEKAARTTQQTFNVGIVLLGVGLMGAVATVLWSEVFSTNSKTAYFNRAADRIRADPQCRKLLNGQERGGKREIEAHGEPSWSRWARNRKIASRQEIDQAGVEHLYMHFYVSGKQANGTVQLHLSRKPGEDFQYQLLALDVPGEQRVYLENASALTQVKTGKVFGINWNR